MSFNHICLFDDQKNLIASYPDGFVQLQKGNALPDGFVLLYFPETIFRVANEGRQ